MKPAYHRLKEGLRERVGTRGFPTALACAAAAVLSPTLTLIKVTLFHGTLRHPAWLLLTPAFALLAKLFIGVDWLVAKQWTRVLLVSALLVAASLELVYLGHLLGIKLPI